MNTIGDRLSAKIEAEAARAASEPNAFEFREYDDASAEKTGYSNYSYWGSTLRVFMKNKTALVLLIVLAVLVSFTIIQPYIGGQYGATEINNYPMTGLQISNLAPTRDNILWHVDEGTVLVYAQVNSAPGWYAVTNALTTIPRRTDFTVTEYGEDWCAVEYGELTGYVKNDFTTKLKLPDEPENTPYECKSNFAIGLYSSDADHTNPDANSAGWVYLRASDARVTGDNTLTVAVESAPLYLIPATNGFWFGTNNIGQDLWARVWGGTRTSLYIGLMVALVEAFVGILVGVLWGYVRALDRLLTEVYNVLDNIPTTIMLILIAYILKPSVSTLIFAMCLTRWMGMARFIRNQIIIIRDRDYNVASRCLGTGTARIMLKNLLPYLVSVIMLRMALAIPGAIGSEVFITYIGLGVPVNTPSLGNLINEGRKLFAISSLRYQLLFPAIVLSIITISFYIIGNAFADAADPKNHV